MEVRALQTEGIAKCERTRCVFGGWQIFYYVACRAYRVGRL